VEKINEALDYRRRGYTYEQIAEAMECVVSTAYTYVKDGLAKIVKEGAEKVRAMMLARLQIMQQKLMEQVAEDLASTDQMAMIIKIDEKIAKLYGFDVGGGEGDDVARSEIVAELWQVDALLPQGTMLTTATAQAA
jgi:hypothetical protein